MYFNKGFNCCRCLFCSTRFLDFSILEVLKINGGVSLDVMNKVCILCTINVFWWSSVASHYKAALFKDSNFCNCIKIVWAQLFGVVQYFKRMSSDVTPTAQTKDYLPLTEKVWIQIISVSSLDCSIYSMMSTVEKNFYAQLSAFNSSA